MNQRPELSERLSTCPLVRLGQNSGKQAIDNNSKIPSSYISENFNYHPLYIDTYEENSEQKYENKQLPVEKSQNFNYVVSLLECPKSAFFILSRYSKVNMKLHCFNKTFR